jgi:hypothetical protein
MAACPSIGLMPTFRIALYMFQISHCNEDGSSAAFLVKHILKTAAAEYLIHCDAVSSTIQSKSTTAVQASHLWDAWTAVVCAVPGTQQQLKTAYIATQS